MGQRDSFLNGIYMSAFTFDTNTIIYYLKGDRKVSDYIEEIFKNNPSIYISTITEVELFGFPKITDTEAYQIEKILETISIIPLDSRIARMAARIRQLYKLKTADSVIAATALFTGSILVTRNVKDFLKVENLQIKSL
jgi:predicted nucleic acid-binding protein